MSPQKQDYLYWKPEDLRNKHKRYLEAAYAVALISPGAGGKKSRFRLGSVLVHKKQIVAARYNCMKTHPVMGFFYDYPYLHSEAYTIISHGLNNCSGLTLYVVRIKRDNSLALALPCVSCQKLIAEVGIKKVIFSTAEGFAQL